MVDAGGRCRIEFENHMNLVAVILLSAFLPPF